MKVIWVLENIQEDENFYGKFNILVLLASVTLWRKYHPTHNCVLYCDVMTKGVLERMKVLHLWDEVSNYTHSRPINRSVFWACNKVAVLSEQTEPVILMDNDTLVFRSFEDILKDEVLVANLEDGQGYYPGNLDPYVKKLSYRARWKPESLNVSFLYFPKADLIKEYTSLSLQMMEEFTAAGTPHSQYLIFAEQLLLRHLLDKHNIPFKSIISTYWDCSKWSWGEDHDKGIWPWPESERHFRHYGPLKSMIINNKTDMSYDDEIKLLLNCINIPNLDVSFIPNK